MSVDERVAMVLTVTGRGPETGLAVERGARLRHAQAVYWNVVRTVPGLFYGEG